MEPTPVVPPLNILYRDEWIVAVDKPPGQLVHPADQPDESDVVTMKVLRDQIGQRVHVVHRLDRPTSGVLLFATDGQAARSLGIAFDNQEVKKVYWAVVIGQPPDDEWICRKAIQKDEGEVARPAETRFRVLEHLRENLTLIEARPLTGRYHQIRRHLLQCGYPIVGDYRYAGIEQCDALGHRLGTGTRMLLQAKSLRFTHPITGAVVGVVVPVDPSIQGLRSERKQNAIVG